MIERITKADREEAVDVLVVAFCEYPVMRFVIEDGIVDYDSELRSLIGFYCDKRLVNGWPVLGIRHDGLLAAVALISKPTSGTAELAELEADLRAALGEAAHGRMELFERTSDANEPPGPHYFVGMLGVRPEHQGMGYGKALLRRAMELAVETGLAGVCLSTEDPDNVRFYKHLGFEEVGEADVGKLHTWCLRWANPGYDPEYASGK